MLFDISALKITWSRWQDDLGRSENVSQKASRDSGHTSGTCMIHRDVLGMRKLSTKWRCCGFTDNSWTLLTAHSRLWQWRNVDTLVRSRDTRTIYRVEAQWFTSSTKFRTHKSASKVMASVFSDKYGILLADCLERGATITASHYTPLLDKESCQQQCCFSRTTPPGTRFSIQSSSWVICTLKCWSLLWPLQTGIWNLKKSVKKTTF